MTRITITVCSVDGCNRKRFSGGLCQSHRLSPNRQTPIRKYTRRLPRTRNGMSRHPLYQTWLTMHQRCYNKSNRSYSRYGKRGISVCERWRLFENFASDMGSKPAGTTLDRIDPNGNYEPTNCRWASFRLQAINRNRDIRWRNRLKGARLSSSGTHWSSDIAGWGHTIHIGTFADRETAAWMYDQYAIAIQGDDAILNFEYL